MAYLNPDVTMLNLNTDLALFEGGGDWIVGKCVLSASATVTTSDVIDIFAQGSVRGFYVCDWWVAIPQVDGATTASATCAFHIGVASDPTGISGTAGLRWQTSAVAGHVVGGQIIRATNMNHFLQNGHNNPIGVQCVTPAHSATWAGKTFMMGLKIKPVID